ncbi:MAG: endolytic transglycosylase MltG [Thermoanaerobaculales bacterium]|nr:endolytic transglycosylase MltG [Thermoanaerobaculales bacterium]
MWAKKRPGRHPVRRALGAVVGAGVLLVAGVAFWLWGVLWYPRAGQTITLEIARGVSTSSILEQFNTKGLLPSVNAGRLYLEVAARKRSLRWGRYVFEPGTRPVDVLEMALDGQVQTLSVTIVEGISIDEVKRALLASGLAPSVAWDEFVNNTKPIVGLAPRAKSLEGFLFPDTYTFADGVDIVTVADHMVARFHGVWEEERLPTGAPARNAFDAVILASLIEAETALGEERARIAGVFTNRLARGMLLQCDPTVVYALKRRGEWSGRLLRAHWKTDDPYNTYRYPGLPPGPINNPGRAALAAALSPEKHHFLYFVADAHGGHTFSRTLKEHNRAVAQLRRSRH